MDHVTKSISDMAEAIQQKGKPAQREIGEKIEELKKTFLDLTLKMQSPDFIIPGNGPFEKLETIEALNTDRFIEI